MADGFTILVTWPQVSDGKHVQDTWYAHLGDQAAAVRAVQEASGALNDAKIEILGPLQHDELLAHAVAEGEVGKALDSTLTPRAPGR